MLGLEPLGRLDGPRHHRGERDDRHVGPLADDRRLAERHDVLAVGHLALVAKSALCSQKITGSGSRIAAAISPTHVGRVRGRDDLEAGDRHRPVLDALAVLRAEPETRAVRGPEHERERDLAVGHVAGLGDLVRDHVPGDREEVAEHQLGDRAQAGHRGAHRRADDRLLADRRVADALGPELGEQPLGELEHAAGGADVLADEHHGRVALHLLGDPCGDRRPVRQLRHAVRHPFIPEDW